MIHNLFSVPIYKFNIAEIIDIDDLRKNLLLEFNDISSNNFDLEKNGGKSTYNYNAKLHNKEYMTLLNEEIYNHVKMYWKILDIDQGLVPVIDECWSNIHYATSYTESHSHSLMPIVATFYVQAAEDCGELVFINPMEYSITHLPYSVPIEHKIESRIKVKTGDLILFPGYVRHKTGYNLSGQDRIVLSYNFRADGTYLNSRSSYPNHSVSINNELSDTNFLLNKIHSLETIIAHMQRNITNGK